MSRHEKDRNKKMPIPRQNIIHNPIPTSLFCLMFVMNALGKENSKKHLDIQIRCGLERNKDVGMGL